ncbi:MAG: nitrate ABC transporter substrate-binding protein [Bradyrhizobiaceae bacterium]|nr:MAG: nitrate ABC transporter substrate-binding protein [Bradyrhizobiaceae bacterium]
MGRSRILSQTLAVVLALAAGLAGAAAQAPALDKLTLATNWLAQAEHGGFYQALADGTYRRHGLDVTIVQGGPQVDNHILMTGGRVDFVIRANSLDAFAGVGRSDRTIVVAAMFQKDPQALLAHPVKGVEKFADLKELTLFLSKEGRATFFAWLQSEFGFREANVKAYSADFKPFLADQRSATQGYVTSEPFAIERLAGMRPRVFLLADHGFNGYSTLIEARRETVDEKPGLVQRFVDASIIGWYNYLYGDNAGANARIKRDNPLMTDALLAHSLEKMREFGIVDSGDTLRLGIGAMTDSRMASFFDKMAKAGVVPANLDFRRAYTLRFVNKGVGLELRSRN